MLTEADTRRALNIPCPLIFCGAFIGEDCVSRHHPGLTVAPHRHRLVKAGVIARPPAPVAVDDVVDESA